jgi:hypothetical protein
MSGKLSKTAKACIAHEIEKHCAKKRGKCRKSAARKQAVAISYNVCRRQGFRSIPSRK